MCYLCTTSRRCCCAATVMPCRYCGNPMYCCATAMLPCCHTSAVRTPAAAVTAVQRAVDVIAPTCSRWRTERNYRPRRVYGACIFIALYDHQNRPRKNVQQKTRPLRVSVLSSRPMQPFDRWYFISRCLLPGNARWCCCLSIATTCHRWLIKKRKRLHRVSLRVFCL